MQLHYGALDEGVNKGIDIVNAQNSDLILFTGDMANNKASEMTPWINDFARLQAPYGKYSVLGNHDYGATGSAPPGRFGAPGSPAVRSIELACERLSDEDVAWMRSRRPAARRDGVQCWHGGPRNPVHEYVGASNAGACLALQRADIGLVGHTHVAAAWRQTPDGAAAVKVRVGEPLDLAGGKWLLNPGAVGAPASSRSGWWDGLDAQAADGACWLLLDLERRSATWRRAPYDPVPARARARALGLDDAGSSPSGRRSITTISRKP